MANIFSNKSIDLTCETFLALIRNNYPYRYCINTLFTCNNKYIILLTCKYRRLNELNQFINLNKKFNIHFQMSTDKTTVKENP